MLILSACGGTIANSPATRIEPLPVKVGGLRDNEIDFAVPLVLEKRKTGGWRSPVEAKIRILLTSPAAVPLPVLPNGAAGGVRFRW